MLFAGAFGPSWTGADLSVSLVHWRVLIVLCGNEAMSLLVTILGTLLVD